MKMSRQAGSSSVPIRGQQASTSSSFQSYRTEELQQARTVLMASMNVTPYSLLKRKLMTSDQERNLHRSFPNTWEGEDGMMTHIQRAFPMPQIGMPDENFLYDPSKPKPAAASTDKEGVIDLTDSPPEEESEVSEPIHVEKGVSVDSSAAAPICVDNSPMTSGIDKTPYLGGSRLETGKSVNVDSQIKLDSRESIKSESTVSFIPTINSNGNNSNEEVKDCDDLFKTSQNDLTKTTNTSLPSVSDMSKVEPNASGCLSFKSSEYEQDMMDPQLNALFKDVVYVKAKVQMLAGQIRNFNMRTNESLPKEEESLKSKFGRLIFLGTLIKELIARATAGLRTHKNSGVLKEQRAKSINRLMTRIVKVYMKTLQANSAFLENHLHVTNIRTMDVHWQAPEKTIKGERPAVESKASLAGSSLTVQPLTITTSLFETAPVNELYGEKLFWWRTSKLCQHMDQISDDLNAVSRLLQKESQLTAADSGVSQGLQLCFRVGEKYMQIKNALHRLKQEKKQYNYRSSPPGKQSVITLLRSQGYKRVPGGFEGLQKMESQLKTKLYKFIDGERRKKKKKAKKDKVTKPAAQCDKTDYSPIYERLGILGEEQQHWVRVQGIFEDIQAVSLKLAETTENVNKARSAGRFSRMDFIENETAMKGHLERLNGLVQKEIVMIRKMNSPPGQLPHTLLLPKDHVLSWDQLTRKLSEFRIALYKYSSLMK